MSVNIVFVVNWSVHDTVAHPGTRVLYIPTQMLPPQALEMWINCEILVKEGSTEASLLFMTTVVVYITIYPHIEIIERVPHPPSHTRTVVDTDSSTVSVNTEAMELQKDNKTFFRAYSDVMYLMSANQLAYNVTDGTCRMLNILCHCY